MRSYYCNLNVVYIIYISTSIFVLVVFWANFWNIFLFGVFAVFYARWPCMAVPHSMFGFELQRGTNPSAEYVQTLCQKQLKSQPKEEDVWKSWKLNFSILFDYIIIKLNKACNHPISQVSFHDNFLWRLGLQRVMEIGTTADAFQPIDGGAGRACRGANQTDTQPAYYINYNPWEVPTLAACKAMCSGTADCRGIQFSIYGCQIWTRPEGIENTATSPDLTCLRYSPFRLAGGFPGRSCRGNDSTDNAPSNFEWSQVASISACQKNCLDTPECAGIDYDDRTSGCKVWTRSILASVKSNDVTCMRYEPFLAADGGVDRSCRGAGVTDEWPSYYVVHNHTWSTGPSIDECKERCLAMPGCRGLEYTKASCKVWTNPIQSTALQQGSLCLRFGSFDPYELLDAFVAVHGGQDRACRGSNSSDIDASYYTSVGPARAGTLEACKALCMRTSGCNAIQFSLSECQLWTRSHGVEATALTEGVQCLRLQPFPRLWRTPGPLVSIIIAARQCNSWHFGRMPATVLRVCEVHRD